MNSKERILTALGGKQPDKVPICELYINESILVNLACFLGLELPEIKTAKAAKSAFAMRRAMRDDRASRRAGIRASL